MKYLVLFFGLLFFLVFVKPWTYLPDVDDVDEQTNVAQTVQVDVDVEVDVESKTEAQLHTAEITSTTATTTDATTEAVTEESTTEATTETVTTETTTEGIPVEHYWEYSYYAEYEDIVYYKCCIEGCTEIRSEKVSNIDVLLLETETGVQLVVYGGLYPSAELYVQYNDFHMEEVTLIDTLYTIDEYNGYANIDLNQVSWITIKAYDATSRRMLVMDYAVKDGRLMI